MKAALARPAIFGLADGMMSLLGVILYLMGHQSLILPAALSGGISSALSMAGGEWLSDSKNGLGASAVMGAATGLGAIFPALPYAVTSGAAALAASVVICVLIGVVVALMRPNRSKLLGVSETFGILGAIFLVVLICGLFLPGSAALCRVTVATCGPSIRASAPETSSASATGPLTASKPGSAHGRS